MTAPPPYALAVPVFEFPALAALTGRASLGSGREIAVACLCAARLADGAVPPLSLPAAARAERAASARLWFASLALPPATRTSFARLLAATAENDRAALADALRALLRVVDAHLDAGGIAELERLVQRSYA